MESTTTKRPCFKEGDDGLASLADMEAGFYGNSHRFFSRSFSCLTRKSSLRNLSNCFVSAPRSGRENPNFVVLSQDSENLREALKYSAQMLSELCTSKLFSHKYYELYMRAFDELEMFFKEETRRGCSIIDLYELMQQICMNFH